MASKIKVGKRTHTDHLRKIIESLASQEPKDRMCGTVLWSVVGELCAIGSTSAHRLCVELGFNPDTKVVPLERVDGSCQVVRGYCSACEEDYDLDYAHKCTARTCAVCGQCVELEPGSDCCYECLCEGVDGGFDAS